LVPPKCLKSYFSSDSSYSSYPAVSLPAGRPPGYSSSPHSAKSAVASHTGRSGTFERPVTTLLHIKSATAHDKRSGCPPCMVAMSASSARSDSGDAGDARDARDAVAGASTPPSVSRQTLSKQGWEDLKPLIQKLYIDENRKFTYIADIIREDHGFLLTLVPPAPFLPPPTSFQPKSSPNLKCLRF
jgi:hypothetical protein